MKMPLRFHFTAVKMAIIMETNSKNPGHGVGKENQYGVCSKN
jgi:hypothetical protein